MFQAWSNKVTFCNFLLFVSNRGWIISLFLFFSQCCCVPPLWLYHSMSLGFLHDIYTYKMLRKKRKKKKMKKKSRKIGQWKKMKVLQYETLLSNHTLYVACSFSPTISSSPKIVSFIPSTKQLISFILVFEDFFVYKELQKNNCIFCKC